MNIEDIWASRSWADLTSEERIATVRLVLQEVARAESAGPTSLRNRRGDVVSLSDFMTDMASDVARILERVINPAEGPAQAAADALASDLREATCAESSLLAFGQATLRDEIGERANDHRDLLSEAGRY